MPCQCFKNVVCGLENTILDRSQVSSGTHHLAKILDRVRADVGSDVVIFDRTEVQPLLTELSSTAIGN